MRPIASAQGAGEDLWLAFLLALGLAREGWSALSRGLRRWDDSQGTRVSEQATEALGYLRLLGGVAAGRAQVLALAARVRARIANHSWVAQCAAIWVEQGGRGAAAVRTAKGAIVARLARWEELGRIEARRSETLRQAFLDGVLDWTFALLSTSPELQALVREQSAGVGRSLLEDVREEGARADNAVEARVRRLLRRPPRVLIDSEGEHEGEPA